MFVVVKILFTFLRRKLRHSGYDSLHCTKIHYHDFRTMTFLTIRSTGLFQISFLRTLKVGCLEVVKKQVKSKSSFSRKAFLRIKTIC